MTQTIICVVVYGNCADDLAEVCGWLRYIQIDPRPAKETFNYPAEMATFEIVNLASFTA